MNILQNKKNKVLTKIESLKQINDNPGNLLKTSEGYLDNSVKDIYTELVELAENLISNGDTDKTTFLDTLKEHAYDSIETVTPILKDLLLGLVKKNFFVDDGICGTKTEVTNTTLRLKPKEFDFFDMFKISPTTTVGKVIYENNEVLKNPVNTEFYNIFSGGTYEFLNMNNEVLFSVIWDEISQEYVITLVETDIRLFLEDYYNNISYPTLGNVLKRNISTILKDEKLVTQKTIHFNNVLQKIFGDCSKTNDEQENQTFIGVQEDYTDNSGLFTFNDIEGIELETVNNVMTFRTCYDIEVPLKKDIIEEILYFEKKTTSNNIKNIIEDTFNKVALHSERNSDFSLTIPNIKFSLIKDFIMNLPKILIHNLFSPKYIFPIVLMYKNIKNTMGEINIKEVFAEFKKLFVKLITSIFWGFVNKFWVLVKKSIVKVLKKITKNFTKNKLNRYLLIVRSLISILKKIPKVQFKDCDSLYSMIIQVLNTLLNTDTKVSIPNTLLLLSDRLNGYSQDRAFLNIIENLNSSGISTEPIYGETNNLVKMVKSIIDGNTTEMDENGFIKIVLKGGVIPSGPGGAVITPGVISGVGKMF